ncbi:MAG: lysylphosphatidylglycerol synthase transmembrane domain-containing protein [Myxococcales bacterium]
MSIQTPLRILAVLLVLFACVFFVRSIDPHAVLAAVRAASPGLLVAAAVANLLHLGVRVLRLRELLAPARRVPVGRLFRYSLAFCAGNNLLPARAGEAVRIWLLHSREGIAASTALSASVIEKLCDAVALLVLAAPLPWLIPALPAWAAGAILTSSLLALAAVVVLAFLLRAHREAPLHTLRGRLYLGARALGSPRALAGIALLSLGVWASDAAALILVLRALGCEIPLAGAVFVMLTLNLAIAVPSTPASVGAFELGAVAALRVLQVAEGPALAVALLYHLVQMVPVTVLGLPDLLSITRARAAARAGSSPAAR